MHLLSACCVGSLFITLIYQVSGLGTVVGLYGETVEVPCNNGAAMPKDLFITKWKYDKGDGVSGDLLVKQKDQNATVSANDEYKERVSMAENSSLLISEASLSDQRTFTCMVVAGADIREYPVHVLVQKAPSVVEITEKAEELEIGKLTKLGKCSANDANPAAEITWFKNQKPLADDGKGVVIRSSEVVDPTTGLSSTTSTLEYAAQKEDTEAQFSCAAQHSVGAPLASSAVSFTVIYPTETLSLLVISEEPIAEGDNVTLKCKADGNPAPTSFNFHIKGEVMRVENSDTYTLADVTRDITGEYKCSLIDNAEMEASKNITVNYLDMNLSPSGKVMKTAGEALALTLQTDASAQPTISWKKDGVQIDSQPKFDKLTYSDAGHYECEVTMGALSQKESFELVVEGAPVIGQLFTLPGKDSNHEVLICEAQGSPKPSVYWNINGTSPEESPFANGKITHKLTIMPTANLTVNCTVYNELGQDSKAINISSVFVDVKMDKQDQSDNNDQTKVVVGVVVGLLLAAVVVGLAYGIYMKKSKQGSWKTGEKENGSSEEEKKLEEKVDENSQKAEV